MSVNTLKTAKIGDTVTVDGNDYTLTGILSTVGQSVYIEQYVLSSSRGHDRGLFRARTGRWLLVKVTGKVGISDVGSVTI